MDWMLSPALQEEICDDVWAITRTSTAAWPCALLQLWSISDSR